MGLGYWGKKGVSTANMEIIEFPTNYSNPSYYKFAFYNSHDCNVIINGNPNFFKAEQGFITNPAHNDAPIKSFIIVDADVEWNWTGAY